VRYDAVRMLRVAVLLFLAACPITAQSTWSVTVFATETPSDLSPSSFRMLEHRVIGRDDTLLSTRVGDTDVTVDIRESFRGRRASNVEDGTSPPPNAHLALSTRMGLGRRRDSSAVGLDETPRILSCDIGMRRRSRARLFVAAIFQAPDAPAATAAVLADVCIATLAAGEKSDTEDAPVEGWRRFNPQTQQALDILVRLPLNELLTDAHPSRLAAVRALSESYRDTIFAAAGRPDAVAALAAASPSDSPASIHALAEGWRQTSDKELRARAGIRLFRENESVYGKILVDDIEQGRAVIPDIPEKAKIVDDLNVMATWRNTSSAWLGLLLLLVGSIVAAIGARAALKRIVA